MYSFYQYYKDGSDGSMDCRWFAAFYLMMRLGFYVLFAMTFSAFFYSLALIFTILSALVVITVRKSVTNSISWTLSRC